jgi:Protein of unknown function (DUF3768)
MIIAMGLELPVDKAAQIAALNDLCRKTMGLAGRVYQTRGITALPAEYQSVIREKVETFDVFTLVNDPYGERDFGAFEHNGERIFWKIDYYDATMTRGSEDPSDAKQTVRVLTIMLASEY